MTAPASDHLDKFTRSFRNAVEAVEAEAHRAGWDQPASLWHISFPPDADRDSVVSTEVSVVFHDELDGHPADALVGRRCSSEVFGVVLVSEAWGTPGGNIDGDTDTTRQEYRIVIGVLRTGEVRYLVRVRGDAEPHDAVLDGTEFSSRVMVALRSYLGAPLGRRLPTPLDAAVANVGSKMVTDLLGAPEFSHLDTTQRQKFAVGLFGVLQNLGDIIHNNRPETDWGELPDNTTTWEQFRRQVAASARDHDDDDFADWLEWIDEADLRDLLFDQQHGWVDLMLDNLPTELHSDFNAFVTQLCR